MPSFPITRLRRLRRTETLRRMVRETRLAVDDLIYPLFVADGLKAPKPIPSMPGCRQHTLASLVAECREAAALGIPAIILFGLPASKDPEGREAYSPGGIVQRAVAAVKAALPELVVITDVCLCEYTDHGHCGLLDGREVANDASVDLLARAALSHAQAGADIVAPSDMMDGRVKAIRTLLDREGFSHIPILAYAAKYASGFYGPFRDAADSAPQFGDRRAYQMDPPNRREALREIAQDIEEGADLVMVKPALAYLDVLREARAMTNLPLAAYNVSGEYSMVKAAAANGWIDERRVTLEILTGIKRAGADLILTYHAKEAAQWLKEG